MALITEQHTNTSEGADAIRNSWRLRLYRAIFVGLLPALVIAATSYGIFRPIDDELQAARFALLNRAPTGKVVFVDIDAASLQSVGVWPWPRTIHAKIADRLMELGAKSISFDVDFSTTSTPENDEAFVQALRRAGGFAALGAFEQPAGADGNIVANMPIPAFAAESETVAVLVPLGAGNIVRDYPTSRMLGGQKVLSMGQALGGANLPGANDANAFFGINYAIDVKSVDRISVADLLAGKIASERLRGRDVVVGASAQELHDFVMTPRFGMMPGALVHVMAAETLLQGAVIHDAPWPLVPCAIIFAALLAGAFGYRLGGAAWIACIVILSTSAEAGAFWLQRQYGLRIASAPFHFALLALGLAAIIVELRVRRMLLARAGREREFIRAMLQQVIADHFDGVVILDEAGKILANSSFALDFLKASQSPGGAIILPPELKNVIADCFASHHQSNSGAPVVGQLVLSTTDNGSRYLDYVVTISAIENEFSRRVACLTFRDVTERRAAQQRLKFLASHDSSTGALLRHELIARTEAMLASASHETPVTLILVELRRFSAITGAHGDAVGERILQSVFERLRADGHNIIARIGDANFGLVVPNLPHGSEADCCHSLIERLGTSYQVEERNIAVDIDIGLARSDETGVTAEALLAQARIAQAVARGGSGNRHEIFSPSMEADFREREWIEAGLRQALAKNQFTLNYQPQFDLASGECVGAEALIRWHHPERGPISPAKFIPIAEESLLIVDIGRWALQTACIEASHWPESMSVAVNASPIQLETDDLLGDVRDALTLSGLPATRLTVEITESALVSGVNKTTQLLEALRTRGIGLALDDFGTGYSSLSYLDRLPFDKVKIDQSFIRRIIDDEGASSIVQAILQLAGKLGKTVVAEGVETLAQAKLLKQFGCQTVQGHHYGKAVSSDEFRKSFIKPRTMVLREKAVS